MAYLGTGDPRALVDRATDVELRLSEPASIVADSVEVLNAAIEMDGRSLAPLVPPALALALPPMMTFVFWRCIDSNVGPFQLAQARVATRLGARSRGFLLSSYFEGSADAAERLRASWGFECLPGSITIRSHYDEVGGSVESGGRTVLRVSGRNPSAIASDDIRDMAALNPILVRSDGQSLLRMMQVDTEFRVARASRSTESVLEVFSGDAWHAPSLVTQAKGVRILHYSCEMRIPAARYTVDPALPSDQRSEEVLYEA